MRDLTILANDLIKQYGNADALKVGLKDGSTMIPNYPLRITINGVTYNRITDSNGYTILNINLPVGNYSATISITGDSTYNPATKDVVVKVLSNNIQQQSTKNPKNYFEVNGIQLLVKLNDGFSVTPGIDIKETELLYNNPTLDAPTFYFNQGDHGVEFDISVMMRESYRYGDYTVMDYLNMWHKNLTPVSVVTDALDVPNAKYIMSVKSKKQTNHNFSIWKLRFKQFYENNQSFERMYSEKQSTLSADDLELLKYQTIDPNSSPSAIIALKRKLQSKGSFQPYNEDYQTLKTSKREIDGIWDGPLGNDIWHFQVYVMGGNNASKQGKCDRDTINALVNSDNYQSEGYWDISWIMWNKNSGRNIWGYE